MSSVIRSDSTTTQRPPQSEPLQMAVPNTGVSWAAALAGAITAAALSLALVVLGVGLGLSGASPWSNRGISAEALGISAIAWLTFTQIAASGIGGYLAGRLRTHWGRLHTDEVYFRDTAQGLLSWSLATIATAALMGSAISNMVGTSVSAGASVASAVGNAAADVAGTPTSDATGYWIDTLLRMDTAGAAAAGEPITTPAQMDPNEMAASRAEAARIVLHALSEGRLSPSDTSNLGRIVARRNGVSQAAAEAHVNTVFVNVKKKIDDTAAAARNKADQARKAGAYSSLWIFVALLAGAFVSAVCAVIGGRRRDKVIVRG